MRKALKFALAVVVSACFAMPLTVLAQNQMTGGSLSGRSVDVAGSGISGERVELLRGTEVVTTTTTNGLGEWSFRGVEPGVYIVRMNVRGRIAGVRVTVNGQVVVGTMVVVPAATASPQIGALTNLLTLVPAASTGVISTTAATLQVVQTAELSPAIVLQIIQALPPADAKAFAAAVVSAIVSAGDNAGTFSQYEAQFQTIATTGVIPPATSFAPPTITS